MYNFLRKFSPRETTKIRTRLLRAFVGVLFMSFFATTVVFNVAVRLRFGERDHFIFGQYMYGYEASGALLGRAGMLVFVLTGVMFVMSCVVTYFLAKSITRPIEQLQGFAMEMGQGVFEPNDFTFNEAELADLNNALNKTARQLNAYDTEQKTFFQNASHELRTPLMSIKCYAEGIAYGVMAPEAASQTILQETDKLAELVTDILYLSKLDSQAQGGKKAIHCVQEIMRGCASGQEALAAQRGIQFVYDFPKGGGMYYCDPSLMTRAVDNLISNALRYAKSQVILHCRMEGQGLVFSVADDGSGIEANLLPHVFERFAKGKHGNHGIGLAIVKAIVEAHGGTIQAQNQTHGGAIFVANM